jgi:alanyl-tRNA synthetase
MWQLFVDTHRRYALMRAHTATHLLHAALSEIFPQTKQAGSYVWEDELRFDFFADRLLDTKEIDQINNQINTIIREHHLVTVTEMSYQDAIASGAKAFFEDKYPERVRVVRIGASSWAKWSEVERSPVWDSSTSSEWRNSVLSVELCGGTHVSQTNEIGSFFITEQSAVAAGVKRIVGLTGPRVAGLVQSLMTEKNLLADKVGVPAKQVEAKIDKLITEHSELSHKAQKLSTALVANKAPIAGKLGDNTIDCLRSYEDQWFAGTIEFTEVVASLRSNTALTSRCLYSTSGQYALFHPQAKDITKNLWLKGGGSENFVQGRDEKIREMIN